MLSDERGPPVCLFWMLHTALKVHQILFALLLQTADSGHRGHFRSSCWSLRSCGSLCEGCTNQSDVTEYIHCHFWCRTSSNPEIEWITLSRRSGWLWLWQRLLRCHITDNISFWCLEFVQTKEAMPTAVDPKTMCCWKVACQRFSNRIRLVKQLLHSQVMNRTEWAAGFERMGRSSGKEMSLI